MTVDVSERIRRLLILVPELVQAPDGIPVEALAGKLGIAPEALPEQLDQLMMVGKPPFNPDDLLELYIEDDRVYIELHQSLTRPPRFTYDEVLALAVGAQCLAAGPGSLWSAGLDGVFAKIEEAMTPDERERYRTLRSRIDLGPGSAQGGDVRALLWDAIDRRQPLSIAYFSAWRQAFGEREVHPYALVSHGGFWYLVAGPEGPAGWKLFRLDRVREAHPTGAPGAFEPPELDMDKVAPGGFFRSAGESEARVRVSPERARFARERLPEADVEAEPDGSIVVHFRNLSWDWVSAWVMPFGDAAQVLGPEGLRRKVVDDARRTLARYAAGHTPERA